jgi:hypothetical protein
MVIFECALVFPFDQNHRPLAETAVVVSCPALQYLYLDLPKNLSVEQKNNRGIVVTGARYAQIAARPTDIRSIRSLNIQLCSEFSYAQSLDSRKKRPVQAFFYPIHDAVCTWHRLRL